MIRRRFLISMMLLAFLLVVGCGIPQEEHEAVVAERNAAQAQAETLQDDLTKTKTGLANLQKSYNTAKSELASLQKSYDTAKALGFPPYEVSYAPEITISVEGNEKHVPGLIRGETQIPIRSFKIIDMDAYYPNLRLRDGFVLYDAVFGQPAGGDIPRNVVALHEASNLGFGVEPVNSTHGRFLFAPIENAAAALEYLEFIISEPSSSAYDRDYLFIHSLEEFEKILDRMKVEGVTDELMRTSRDTGEKLPIPPTNVSVATEQTPGKYLVELVYKSSLGPREAIEYYAWWVYSDGSFEESEDSYVFIWGTRSIIL